MILAKYAICATIVFGLPTSGVIAIGGFLASEHDSIALPSWLQYGVLGLVIIGLVVTKQLVPGWIHTTMVNEYKEEIKELKADKRELTEKLFDTQKAAIPALGDATKAIDEALTVVRSRGK